MERHQPVLHVGSSAHLGGAAQQDPHLPGADFGEQVFLLHLRFGFMDERNLFRRHTFRNELLPDVVINRKGRPGLRLRCRFLQSVKQRIVQLFRRLFRRTGLLGRGNIAEHQLGQLIRLSVPPDLHDIVHALVDFSPRLVRQQLVDDSLVQPQLAAIPGDLEHIVNGWVHRAAVYQRRALRKGLHHFPLVFRRLGHDVVVLHLRGGQVQLVGGLDVRHLFEQVHQLRQVEKLGETGARPVAGSLRGQFQRGAGLPKPRRPAVEVGHVQLLQAIVLEIPLHGVKLRHTVRHGGAGGKDHAPAAGQFIHISTFREHVAGFLRVRCG